MLLRSLTDLITRRARTMIRRTSVLTPLVLACLSLSTAAQNQLWIDQLGTPADDDGTFLASDGAGGLFVGGFTEGSLGGPSAGNPDAWLARYDNAGNQIWIRQFGSSSTQYAAAAASDGTGGVYVVGSTDWAIVGSRGTFFYDAWIARYDGAGTQLWIRQFGTDDQHDHGVGCSADGSGGAFVSGLGSGAAWLARYDGNGIQQWMKTFAGGAILRSSTADGSGGVFLCGQVNGPLGGWSFGDYDAWVAHFDGTGNQLWLRQFGSSSADSARSVTIDDVGGVYVSGTTSGALGGQQIGASDGWLAHYDAAGNQTWIRQFGSASQEDVYASAADGSGGVYLAGDTFGALGGSSAGGIDVWLARYDSVGSQIWIQQFGSLSAEVPFAGLPDGVGGVYVTGNTRGSLGGPITGNLDVWLTRFDESCSIAPTTYCTAKVNSLGCSPSIAMSSAPSAASGWNCALSTTNVLGNKSGLFFHSTSGALGAPFHGGFLCAKSPTKRHAVQNSGGTAATCTGNFSEDFNAYIASGVDPALVAGAQVWIQNWSRDNGAPFGDSLSNAVTATICP
jgi:hypothetical protein